MIKLCFAVLLVIFFSTSRQKVSAQTDTYKFADASLAVGNAQGSLSVSLNYDKQLGKNGKVVVGLGGRLTSYLGRDQYYVTAPARLTSGGTGPTVIFKENITENMDTFLVRSPQVNALNFVLMIGYNVSARWMLRFNIDAIGFSFGGQRRGNYINGAQGSIESARPTAFNLLLISDNDIGSLNSELFARYMLNSKWGIKGGLQFLFTEYVTATEIQQSPEPNDRFRKKSLMLSAGVSCKL